MLDNINSNNNSNKIIYN